MKQKRIMRINGRATGSHSKKKKNMHINGGATGSHSKWKKTMHINARATGSHSKRKKQCVSMARPQDLTRKGKNNMRINGGATGFLASRRLALRPLDFQFYTTPSLLQPL